jgi:hypothetical protein
MHFLRSTSTAAVLLLFGAIVPAYAQHEQPGEKQAQPEKQQSKPQPAARPSPQQKKPQPKQQAHQAPKPQPKQQAHQAPKPQPKQQQAHQAPKPQPKQQAHQAPKAQPKQQPKPQQAHQAPKAQPKQQPAHQTQQARQPQGHPSRPQAVAWQKQQGWKQGGAWQPHSTWQQNGDRNWANDHRTWTQRGGYGGYYIPQATYNLSFGSQHWFRMQGQPVIYMGYPRFSYGGFWFLLVDPWPGSWAENWYANDDVYIEYDDGYYLCNRSYPDFRLAITVQL